MLSKNLTRLFIFVLPFVCKFSIGYKCSANRNLNRQFDTLVFAQQWPLSYCKRVVKDGKECKVLPQRGIWTIHGIWPSRFNTIADDQPNCCDSTINLNEDGLQPIWQQLKQNWQSVQKGRADEDFWEYEWMKHGTCGVTIGQIDSSIKYFNQGLYWLKEYNMGTILAKSNITPDNEKSYTLLDIHTAIKSVSNKNPSIQCYIDSGTGEQYLNEIRLCFNHQLELIDCDGLDRRRNKDNVSTNCLNKPVNYRVDVVDQPFEFEWFTLSAVMGLIIFAVVIVILVKKLNVRERLSQLVNTDK